MSDVVNSRHRVVITLLGEPRAKGRPRFSFDTRHAYTPQPTRNYETALGYAGQAAMAGREPFLGPLRVEVLACFSVPRSWSQERQANALNQATKPTRRPDSDNLLKMIDSLNGIVWKDDAQICDARVVKAYSDRPRLVVEVEAM